MKHLKTKIKNFITDKIIYKDPQAYHFELDETAEENTSSDMTDSLSPLQYTKQNIFPSVSVNLE